MATSWSRTSAASRYRTHSDTSALAYTWPLYTGQTRCEMTTVRVRTNAPELTAGPYQVVFNKRQHLLVSNTEWLSLTLTPGPNELSAYVFVEFSKTPEYALWLDLGWIGGPSPGPADPFVPRPSADGNVPWEALYPAYDRRLQLVGPAAPIAVPAGGSPVVIAGPAPGVVRFLGAAQLRNMSPLQSAAITAVHDPSGLHLRRGTMLAPNAGVQLFNTMPVALGYGQSIVVTNDGSAGADAVLWYTYTDYKIDPERPIVALALAVTGQTPVEIVPAAPSGFRHRIVVAHNVLGSQGGGRPSLQLYNDDSAPVTIDGYLGPDFASSGNAAIAANAQSTSFPLGLGADYDVTTKPILYALRAEAATPGRSLNVFVAFSRLPVAS